MPGKEANFSSIQGKDGRVYHLPACAKCDYPVKREDHLTFEGQAYHRYCFKCALTCKNLVGKEVIVWRGRPYLKAALEGKDTDEVKYVDIWTNGGDPVVEGAAFLPRGYLDRNLATYGNRGYYSYGGEDYGYSRYTDDYTTRGYRPYSRGYTPRGYRYGY